MAHPADLHVEIHGSPTIHLAVNKHRCGGQRHHGNTDVGRAPTPVPTSPILTRRGRLGSRAYCARRSARDSPRTRRVVHPPSPRPTRHWLQPRTQPWPSPAPPRVPSSSVATQTAPTAAADVTSTAQALSSASATLASAVPSATLAFTVETGSHCKSPETVRHTVRNGEDSDGLQLQPPAAEVTTAAVTVAARKSRRTMLRSKAITALLSPVIMTSPSQTSDVAPPAAHRRSRRHSDS